MPGHGTAWSGSGWDRWPAAVRPAATTGLDVGPFWRLVTRQKLKFGMPAPVWVVRTYMYMGPALPQARNEKGIRMEVRSFGGMIRNATALAGSQG
jgi:hypothetical protein